MAKVRKYASDKVVMDPGSHDEGGSAVRALLVPAACAPELQADLLLTIEAEIIPRLMLAHRSQPIHAVPTASGRGPITVKEVEEFAELAVVAELSAVMNFVDGLCQQGLSMEALLLELMTPAARLLGDLWLADLRTFTDVTIALAKLQQVVSMLSPLFAPAEGVQQRGLVVLAPAPGEQHTLGIHVVGEFIRKAGWATLVEPSSTAEALVDLVHDEHVDMLGISVSNTNCVQPLAGVISAVRKSSCNPDLFVVLGGALGLDDYVVLTGASACASDARHAVQLLERHAASHAGPP